MTVQGEKVAILKVPWFPQSNTDAKCMACSLKMCIEYFINEYKNKTINKNIPSFDINEILNLTHTREPGSGTPLRNLCKNLEKTGMPLRFSIKSTSINEIKQKIDEDLPVIVIYNGTYLLYQMKGSGHAGVVIGITDDDNVILNNPWFGPIYIPDKLIFEEAWELEYNRALLIEPNIQQTQTELGDN